MNAVIPAMVKSTSPSNLGESAENVVGERASD
jgi:hypothetical protein